MMLEYIMRFLILVIGLFAMCAIMRLIALSIKEEKRFELENHPADMDTRLNKCTILAKKLNNDLDSCKDKCLKLEKIINKKESTEKLLNDLINNARGVDDDIKKTNNKLLIIAILLDGQIYNEILNLYNSLDTGILDNDETQRIILDLNKYTKQLIRYLREKQFDEKDIIDSMKLIAGKFNKKSFSITLYVPDYRANIYENPYLQTQKSSAIVNKIISVAISYNGKIAFKAEVE